MSVTKSYSVKADHIGTNKIHFALVNAGTPRAAVIKFVMHMTELHDTFFDTHDHRFHKDIENEDGSITFVNEDETLEINVTELNAYRDFNYLGYGGSIDSDVYNP